MLRLTAWCANKARQVHAFVQGQRVADLKQHLSNLLDERSEIEAAIENTTRALVEAQNDLTDIAPEKPGFFTVDRHFPDVSPRSY